ncbi:MAG: hypothetical protein RIB84_23835 [Sneathiellaceae bacterium]
MDIEELLRWTYQVQRAHVTDRSAVARTGWGPSMLAAAMERAQLGCAIDGGGYAPAVTHPDADLVHEAVQLTCDNSEMGLVIQHAAAGDRPDDGSGIELRAKLAYVEYDRSRNAKVSWLRWTGTDSEREFARSVYRHWWGAVSRVAADFRRKPRLRGHLVTGFAASPEPWAGPGLTQTKKLDTVSSTVNYAR